MITSVVLMEGLVVEVELEVVVHLLVQETLLRLAPLKVILVVQELEAQHLLEDQWVVVEVPVVLVDLVLHQVLGVVLVVLEFLIQLMLVQHLFLLLRLQVVEVVVVVQDQVDLLVQVVVLEDQVVQDLMVQLILVVAVVELKTVDQKVVMLDQEL